MYNCVHTNLLPGHENFVTIGTAQNCGETVDVTEDNQEIAVNNTGLNLCLRCVSSGSTSSNVQWIIDSIVLVPGGSGLGGNLMNVGGVLVITDPSTLISDGPIPYEITSCFSSAPGFRWEQAELFSSSK